MGAQRLGLGRAQAARLVPPPVQVLQAPERARQVPELRRAQVLELWRAQVPPVWGRALALVLREKHQMEIERERLRNLAKGPTRPGIL